MRRPPLSKADPDYGPIPDKWVIHPIRLHIEVMASQAEGIVTPRLGEFFLWLQDHIVSRYLWRSLHDHREDVAYAVMMSLLAAPRKYDESKWSIDHPGTTFNFLYTCAKMAVRWTAYDIRKANTVEIVSLTDDVLATVPDPTDPDDQAYYLMLHETNDDRILLEAAGQPHTFDPGALLTRGPTGIVAHEMEPNKPRHKLSYLRRLQDDRAAAMTLGYMDMVLHYDEKILRHKLYKSEKAKDYSADARRRKEGK